MISLFCRLDRTSAKAAARSSAAAAFGILQRRGGVRSRVTHCAAAMASPRTAPRGEFVCKHFRALALGVARLWGSHVSRTSCRQLNEPLKAHSSAPARPRAAVLVLALVSAGLSGSACFCINYSPPEKPIHAPVAAAALAYTTRATAVQRARSRIAVGSTSRRQSTALAAITRRAEPKARQELARR